MITELSYWNLIDENTREAIFENFSYRVYEIDYLIGLLEKLEDKYAVKYSGLLGNANTEKKVLLCFDSDKVICWVFLEKAAHCLGLDGMHSFCGNYDLGWIKGIPNNFDVLCYQGLDGYLDNIQFYNYLLKRN